MSDSHVGYNEATLYGLTHWHKKIFEKYGWIKLAYLIAEKDQSAEAKERFQIKFKCFHEMLKAFIMAANKKLQGATNDIHYKDLQIMKNHVELLLKHIELMHSKLPQAGGKKASRKGSRKGSKKSYRK